VKSTAMFCGLLRPSIRSEMDALAKANDRSLSAEVRVALETHLAEESKRRRR
jgi:hypothetical protein